MAHPLRQRIMITGASSGLGAGMARQFAARGRDLALVARRLDRLEALRDELLAQYPGMRVAVAPLDVDDPDAVAAVVPRLAGELGGLDRFIANAGLGKGTPIGTGNARPNRQVLVTNVLGTHACCEAAVALFRAQGAGHLVVVSSVAGVRGMRGTRTAYATSKAADAVLAEGIRADLLGDQVDEGVRARGAGLRAGVAVAPGRRAAARPPAAGGPPPRLRKDPGPPALRELSAGP